MSANPQQPFTTRELTVLADDPSVMTPDGRPLTTKVRIPYERLRPGPRGARFEVIDYDSTTNHFYSPHIIEERDDPYAAANSIESLENLNGDPHFHAQHVFGVAAATLFEFERALGRHLNWGFKGGSHQLKIVPHAFREPNAFYSKEDEAILFGYFYPEGAKAPVFTCLSHDIVAHETTHAILDGLRSELTRPSSPDQAAFHEGFADIVALLSTLRSESLLQFALGFSEEAKGGKRKHKTLEPTDRLPLRQTMQKIVGKSFVLGLAEQLGAASGLSHRRALRRSIVELPPDPKHLSTLEEPHSRGEVLVAAVLNAFLRVWEVRLAGKYKLAAEPTDPALAKSTDLKKVKEKDIEVDAWRVAEEGAKAAQHLLIMLIRGIDYMPPVHVEFKDFLMAVLTADWQACPDDSTYRYRDELTKAFAAFGIKPDNIEGAAEGRTFRLFDKPIRYARGNTEAMRWDRDGMFRFIWDNIEAFDLVDDVYTRVNSVRSVWRVAPDGVILRETVVEYYQLITQASVLDLKRYEIVVPAHLTYEDRFELSGGGTIILDEFGTVKYHITHRLRSWRQRDRLATSWRKGLLYGRQERSFAISNLHASGLDVEMPTDKDW